VNADALNVDLPSMSVNLIFFINESRAFVSGKPFQPNLISMGKAKSQRQTTERYSLVGSSIPRKYLTGLVSLVWDKCLSILAQSKSKKEKF
jgi:hypothetical protein